MVLSKIPIVRVLERLKNVEIYSSKEFSSETALTTSIESKKFVLVAVIVTFPAATPVRPFSQLAVSSGFNSETKCHRLQAKLDKDYYKTESSGKIHAETSALLPLRRTDLSRASIFIYRETKNGTKALARPCPCCQKLIKQFGIKHIYYTGNNSLVYEEFI